jgi:putative membrane protein insertion efficiency factor
MAHWLPRRLHRLSSRSLPSWIKSLIDRLLIVALRFYKRWVSPMLGQRCRFVPTCSEYSMTAIERFGAVHGSWLTVRRLARCHPLCPGGHDPVPDRATPDRPAPPRPDTPSSPP